MDVAKTRFPFTKKVNLGLDLQGGLYLVMGVDFNQVYKEVVDRQATSLGNRLKEKGVAGRRRLIMITLPTVVRVLIAAALTAALLAAWAIWTVLQDPLGVARILQRF